MKLKDADIGATCRVTGYASNNRNYRQKLLQMGLVKGSEFVVIRKAPLGDPVEIQMPGFNLTLRKTEADALNVELT
ncbi:ferrous iron transport protein A [Verrucomicrobiota bacterium]